MPSNPFIALAAADFGTVATKLLPPGRALPGFDAPTLAATLQGLADQDYAIHAASVALLQQEADPATANALLAEWEADYGLPDHCTPLGSTIAQRQASLLAKIASVGGQSDAYLIAVAAALGFTITIAHQRASKFGATKFGEPWNGPDCDYTMVIDAPGVTLTRAKFGTATFGDPYDTVAPAELECRLRSIAPASDWLLFIYSGS